ncbi:hypothetical protein [Absidia glauca]|uniref:Chromo domain-containing protein n=1 Tax=Absidia glauca TaxID=4829 RepID=A0A163K908_ABSGL|nr:hypothetical protein [Absidia glauca]
MEEKTMQTIKKQKETFDKKYKLRDFKVGSSVRIKIREGDRNKMDAVYEGPYEVVRKTDNGTYVLRDTMNQLMNRHYQPSELAHVADEHEVLDDVYEVEAVVDHKLDQQTNKYTYKVKWLNYDDSHNTWAPEENFYSQQCIQQYWKRIGQEPRVEKKRRQKQYNKKSNKKRRGNSNTSKDA